MISVSRTHGRTEMQVRAYDCAGSLHNKPTLTSTVIFCQFIKNMSGKKPISSYSRSSRSERNFSAALSTRAAQLIRKMSELQLNEKQNMLHSKTR